MKAKIVALTLRAFIIAAILFLAAKYFIVGEDMHGLLTLILCGLISIDYTLQDFKND